VRTSSQILSSTRETPVITRVTDSSELPPLSEVSAGPDRWDLIEGLNAELFQGSAVISGQRILRLLAVGADGRHALGVRFGELAPAETADITAVKFGEFLDRDRKAEIAAAGSRSQRRQRDGATKHVLAEDYGPAHG